MTKVLFLIFFNISYFNLSAQVDSLITDSNSVFKISYPATWESEENTKPNTLILLKEALENDNDYYQENFSVVLEEFTENNYSLKKYSELAEKSFTAYFKKSNVYKRESIELDGKKGNKLWIDAKLGKYKLSFVQYHIVFDRKAYVISYSMETKNKEKYLVILEQIMESFKFK